MNGNHAVAQLRAFAAVEGAGRGKQLSQIADYVDQLVRDHETLRMRFHELLKYYQDKETKT